MKQLSLRHRKCQQVGAGVQGLNWSPGEVCPGGRCLHRHRHAHALHQIRSGGRFPISDTRDLGGGTEVSLWSAWLSAQKKVSSQEKMRERGCGTAGKVGGGGRPVRSGPSLLCPL